MGQMRRRGLLAGLGAGLAVGSLALSGRSAAAQPVIRLPGDITSGEKATVTAIATRQPVVAMTFDDGPHPRNTPVLLDMLRARGIRATFYVLGQNVERYPQLVLRMRDEGHEVGNHTFTHPMLTKRSDAQVIQELDRTTSAIYRATGKVPVTMRPPYGAMTSRQRLMVHDRRNMPTILWSVDPQDWRRPGSSVVASRILRNTRPGGIILSHDIHSPTIKAMPQTLDGLSARGFQFVTVSEMLGWPRWNTRHFRLTPDA